MTPIEVSRGVPKPPDLGSVQGDVAGRQAGDGDGTSEGDKLQGSDSKSPC